MERPKLTRIILLPLLFLTITTLITSCRYSDNISLSIEYNTGATNFSDSTKMAYLSTQKAYRRAEGLAAFPDGGQSKYVYSAKGLYVYDVVEDKLTFLKDLTKPTKHPGYVLLRPRLVFKNNLVYYDCSLDTLKAIDSLDFLELKRQYSECFTIDINTKALIPIDTTLFNEVYHKYRKRSIGGMFRRAKEHPLAEWGLILKDIYPKSDEQYIEYFITWKTGGNSLTRRAILEQIIVNKSEAEIKNILNRMDKYKTDLDDYERSSYELWIKDDYEALVKMLGE